MDIEQQAKKLREGKNAEAFQKLTESEAGARLQSRFAGSEIEEAARRGDGAALAGMLRQILATPEGKEFARQVLRTVNRDGE